MKAKIISYSVLVVLLAGLSVGAYTDSMEIMMGTIVGGYLFAGIVLTVDKKFRRFLFKERTP